MLRLLLLLAALIGRGGAFLAPQRARARPLAARRASPLLLDHLNLNHEKGRHDLLKAFYFDVLGCAVDPRKEENLEKGRKTLWANSGINQFHLPEAETAQVLDGVVSMAYPSLDAVRARLEDAPAVLAASKFAWHETDGQLVVTDPWGSRFRIFADPSMRDERGVQPGDASEPCAVTDLCVHVPEGGNLRGIGNFYRRVLDCDIRHEDENSLAVAMGPKQTLTFRYRPADAPLAGPVAHAQLETVNDEDGVERTLNHGIHISLYIPDLPSAYERAEALGVTFVNHRFKRRAHTMEEAVDQCMFRLLDIVDPEQPDAGPILRLEHEVRSVLKADGSLYKSCPFYEIPLVCSSIAASRRSAELRRAARAAVSELRRAAQRRAAARRAAEVEAPMSFFEFYHQHPYACYVENGDMDMDAIRFDYEQLHGKHKK